MIELSFRLIIISSVVCVRPTGFILIIVCQISNQVREHALVCVCVGFLQLGLLRLFFYIFFRTDCSVNQVVKESLLAVRVLCLLLSQQCAIQC